MTSEELSLTHANAQLRNAVTEALKLYPDSDSAITMIAGKLDTTATIIDKIEILSIIRDNLLERKDALITRHPDVKYLFEHMI